MTFPLGWTKRCALTSDKTRVLSDQTNFPTYFNRYNLPTGIFADAKSDGSDIRFSSDISGNTPLPTEIVFFTPANSGCEIWVQVPSWSSSTNNIIYVWYGNPTATLPYFYDGTNYGGIQVWDTNTNAICIHHYNQSGNFINSQGNSSNDTLNTNIGYQKNGVWSTPSAASWSGNLGSRVEVNTNLIPSGSTRTYIGVINNASWGVSARGRLISEEISTAAGMYFGVDTAQLRFGAAGVALYSAANMILNTWQHVAVTRTATSPFTLNFYVSGVQSGTPNQSTVAAGSEQNSDIGSSANNSSGRFFDGLMDELQVYSDVKTANYINLCYVTMMSPTWITAGTPTSLMGLPKICVSNTWKNVSGIYVAISGVWKEAKRTMLNITGVWKNQS